MDDIKDMDKVDNVVKVVMIGYYLETILEESEKVICTDINNNYLQKKIKSVCNLIVKSAMDLLKFNSLIIVNPMVLSSMARYAKINDLDKDTNDIFCLIYDVIHGNIKDFSKSMSGNINKSNNTAFKRQLYFNNLLYNYYLNKDNEDDEEKQTDIDFYKEMQEYVKLYEPQNIGPGIVQGRSIECIKLSNVHRVSYDYVASLDDEKRNDSIIPYLPNICYEFLYNKVYNNVNNPILKLCLK